MGPLEVAIIIVPLGLFAWALYALLKRTGGK